MATAIYVQDDEYVDYTPTTDVAAGDVIVQGDLVGVARKPIPANTLGALAVEGVFDFAKATGAGSGIAAGTKVYFDAVNEVATATVGSNKYLGKTVRAAADADTTVRVALFSSESAVTTDIPDRYDHGRDGQGWRSPAGGCGGAGHEADHLRHERVWPAAGTISSPRCRPPIRAWPARFYVTGGAVKVSAGS